MALQNRSFELTCAIINAYQLVAIFMTIVRNKDANMKALLNS